VVEGIGDHGCEYMTGGRVVVLGSTGRNFGAGMSGGVAFVWDPDGRLPDRYNPEMVALESLDTEDVDWLRERLGLHAELTGSTVAAQLLTAETALLVRDFTKVMPLDYRRVLDAARQAEEDGIPVEEAIMAAAHG
jgi:glutamate synthase (NADPH/NADH) large chain